MFYYLSEFSSYFGPLRLFEYITFRAGCAATMAFLIVAVFGKQFAVMLRNFNIRAADRYKDLLPEELLEMIQTYPFTSYNTFTKSKVFKSNLNTVHWYITKNNDT